MVWQDIAAALLLTFVIVQHDGTTEAKRSFRIINGRIAKVMEFPYQLAIEQYGLHWCGGTIVTDIFVISAAHCATNTHKLSPIPEDVMRIRVGTDMAERGGIIHAIDSITIHENYGEDQTVDEYDISVMKVERPFMFTDEIQPISLTDHEPMDGSMGWITGYGHTEIMRRSGGGSDKYLMAVELPIMNRDQCRQIHGGFGNQVTENMICAGYGIGHKDACKGDSGGPLAVDNMLVGVTAWGQGCGQEGVPGVYTSIAKYRGWIDQTFRKMSGMPGRMRRRYG